MSDTIIGVPRYGIATSHQPLRELLESFNIYIISRDEVRKIKRSLCASGFHYLLSFLPPFVHNIVPRLMINTGSLFMVVVIVHGLVLNYILSEVIEISPLSGWLYASLCVVGLPLFFTGVVYESQKEKLNIVIWFRLKYNPFSGMGQVWKMPELLEKTARDISRANPEVGFKIEYEINDPLLWVKLGRERYCIGHWE